MTKYEKSSMKNVGKPLLAALSLLGASLGVSAAEPVDSPGGQPRVRGRQRGRQDCGERKGSTNAMGWDVKTSKQYKENSRSIHIKPPNKQLPAVQSNQYK